MKKSQIDQAIEFSSNATKASTGALGVVVQETVMDHALDYNGYVLLNPSAFDSLARYGISKDKMISAAKNLGMLREQGGKNTKNLVTSIKQCYLVLVVLTKLSLKI